MNSKKCKPKMPYLTEPIRSLNLNKINLKSKSIKPKNLKESVDLLKPEIAWKKSLKKKEISMK